MKLDSYIFKRGANAVGMSIPPPGDKVYFFYGGGGGEVKSHGILPPNDPYPPSGRKWRLRIPSIRTMTPHEQHALWSIVDENYIGVPKMRNNLGFTFSFLQCCNTIAPFKVIAIILHFGVISALFIVISLLTIAKLSNYRCLLILQA